VQGGEAADAVADQHHGRQVEVGDELLEPADVQLQGGAGFQPVRASESGQVDRDHLVGGAEVLDLVLPQLPVRVALGRKTIGSPTPRRR
jgi:hypothetical protein